MSCPPRFVCALARALARASVLAALAIVGASAASASPIRPYYDFVHWFSVGRADLALEQFAADAVVVAGPLCTEESPCVGHAAIRARYFGALEAGRTALPIAGQRFDGRRLRAVAGPGGELVFEGHRIAWRVAYVFEFRDDRIAVLRVVWEFDPEARPEPASKNQALR
jgi:hypothetical protein